VLGGNGMRQLRMATGWKIHFSACNRRWDEGLFDTAALVHAAVVLIT
jgi:hypothetical protein